MLIFLIFNFFWQPGVTGASFLKLGIGARAVAMGSAYTGIVDDANVIFYNPAGIGMINSFDGSLMMMKIYEKVNYSSLGIALPAGRKFSLGMGASLLSFSDTRWLSPWQSAGEYSNHDFLILTNLSYKPFRRLALGGNFKFIHSRLDAFSAHSLALDFGLVTSPIKNLFLGASLLHLGTPRRFIASLEYLPLNLRGGVSYKVAILSKNLLTLASDLSFYPDVMPTLGIGGEFLIKEFRKKKESIAFRLGYRSGFHLGASSGLSFGIGYIYEFYPKIFLSVDATYLDYGFIGSAERISLSLKYQPED